MSYSFYVSCDPPSRDVLASGPPVEIVEGVPLIGPFAEGEVLHVVRPGLTARSVEVAYEEGSFSARVMTLASPEDYELALLLVCEVARRAGTEVESEEGVRFPPDAVDAHYGRDWIDEHVHSLVGSIRAVVREHGEVQMSGATNMVTLDAPFLDRLFAGLPDRAQQSEALLAVFRDVNFPPEAYYRANVMQVTLRDGRTRTMVVWGPGVTYQLPRTELVALLAEEQVLVPWSALADLAGERLSPVDAATVRVEAVPDEAWADVVQRARAVATTLEGPDEVALDAPSEEASTATAAALVASAVALVAIGIALWLVLG